MAIPSLSGLRVTPESFETLTRGEDVTMVVSCPDCEYEDRV